MKKKKQKDWGIDENLCNEKSIQIGEIIDGLTVPNILCILGSVIINLVVTTRSQSIVIDRLFKGWLQSIIDRIGKLPDTEEEDEIVVN